MSNRKSPISGAELPRGRPFVQGKEQQAIASRGGKASAEARRHKRSMRQELEYLLSEQRDDGHGVKQSIQKGITVALVKEALQGNTKAYEIIRDTIGQKPAETVNVNTPDNDVMAEIRKRLENHE